MITIYKAFVRPHLDYGVIIYEQVYYASSNKKLELFQYNTCQAIIEAISGDSKEKLYQEFSFGVGLKNYALFTRFKNHTNLSNTISQKNSACNIEIVDKILLFKTKHTLSGICPSFFTNVRFGTKIEFLSVLFHER